MCLKYFGYNIYMYISFEINESGKEAAVKGVPKAGRKLTVRKAARGRPQTESPLPTLMVSQEKP